MCSLQFGKDGDVSLHTEKNNSRNWTYVSYGETPPQFVDQHASWKDVDRMFGSK